MTITGSDIIFAVPLFLAASEVFMFALMAVKGMWHFRLGSQVLLDALYRDALTFSMIPAIVSFSNVILLGALNTGLRGNSTLFLTPQGVTHSIISGHIILLLRQANGRAQTNHRVKTSDVVSRTERV